IVETGPFPSSPRRGGRDINKMSRSHRCGADGVVSNYKQYLCWNLLTTINASPYRACASRPSARLRRLRAIFLIAQPPILGAEGNVASSNVSDSTDILGALTKMAHGGSISACYYLQRSQPVQF